MELEGTLDLSRFRQHRFSPADFDLEQNPADFFVRSLRVMIDPERASGVVGSLRWDFEDGTTAGVRIRNCVAVPDDGAEAEAVIEIGRRTWTEVLCSKQTFDEAIIAGTVRITGDETLGRRLLSCFDHPSLVT
ncbi:MAG: hypothetical protein GY925_21820, partial [Actinomycetia bacterium]|nr:hypothetical protein [Actinomycetes bacterium]